MLIDKVALYAFGKSQLSFLEFTGNTSNINEAECVVIPFNRFANDYQVSTYKFIESIKDKFLVVDFTFENINYNDFKKIDSMTGNYKIFTNGIYGNFCNEPVDTTKVHVEPFFISHITKYKPVRKLKNIKSHRKNFLYMVGKCRVHRLLLLKQLFIKNLIKDGYVSYFLDDNLNFDNQFKRYAPKGLIDFFKKRNMSLDTEEFSYEVSHEKLYERKFYDLVDFVIVAETDILPGQLFFTEKVGKCILLDKKFILLASPNSLETLKYYCRKYLQKDISHLTDWVDTSYDKERDLEKRIDMIIKLVKTQTNS